MTSKTSNTYFKQLTNKEKASKVHQAALGKVQIKVWKKGQTKRLSTKIDYFDKNDLILFLDSKETDLVNLEILYSFELSGLLFCGQGKLFREGKYLKLDCSGDLFKTERRKNFRLLTYPAHSVNAIFKLDGYAEQSNVIQLQTGFSQTGLFNKFLEMIGDEGGNKFDSGYVPIRVQDISVTGLAIVVGELERSYFEEKTKVGTIYIDFGKEKIKIDDTEVIYIVEALSQVKGTKAYKVGIQFLNISEEIDAHLSSQINSLIRITDDKEFEDFIK